MYAIVSACTKALLASNKLNPLITLVPVFAVKLIGTLDGATPGPFEIIPVIKSIALVNVVISLVVAVLAEIVCPTAVW